MSQKLPGPWIHLESLAGLCFSIRSWAAERNRNTHGDCKTVKLLIPSFFVLNSGDNLTDVTLQSRSKSLWFLCCDFLYCLKVSVAWFLL